MAVNGIEIEAGQKWLDRTGNVVEIDNSHEAGFFNTRSPGDRVLKATVSEFGKSVTGDYDLIALVEYADGFEHWTGGCQPAETIGKQVEYRVRDGWGCVRAGETVRWEHTGSGTDVVGYKIVSETKTENDGCIGTGNIYIKPYVGPGESQPPLNVEMLEPPKDALDIQVGGDHYKSLAIQPVEYIHANCLGYFEGNVIKYVSRWRAKNGIKDLEKAKHYIDLLIELEGGAK